MLSALLAEWLHSLPEIALGYLIAFGVRIGPPEKPWAQVHGVVTSFWLVAQGIAGAREELRNEFGLVKGSLDRCEKKLDTIDSKLKSQDGELRFSIRQ